MALTSFAEVRAFIDKVLADNQQTAGVGHAPHRAFWNTLTYDQFTTGNVPGVTDNGQPVRILVPSSSATSNLIHALNGTGIFDPATGSQDQMPANGPPWFTPDQVKQLADWIDHGCPQ